MKLRFFKNGNFNGKISAAIFSTALYSACGGQDIQTSNSITLMTPLCIQTPLPLNSENCLLVDGTASFTINSGSAGLYNGITASITNAQEPPIYPPTSVSFSCRFNNSAQIYFYEPASNCFYNEVSVVRLEDISSSIRQTYYGYVVKPTSSGFSPLKFFELQITFSPDKNSISFPRTLKTMGVTLKDPQ